MWHIDVVFVQHFFRESAGDLHVIALSEKERPRRPITTRGEGHPPVASTLGENHPHTSLIYISLNSTPTIHPSTPLTEEGGQGGLG
jgi:hypothetical protein